MIISSQQNPVYKKLRTLLTAKGIKEHNQCLMAGARITKEYISKNPQADFYWVMRSDQNLPPGQFKNTVTLARELFETLDESGSHHPLLCVPTPSFADFADLSTSESAVYCSVGDPANMGAILRSAIAFGIHQVVLTKEACHPFLPKSIRSSSGYALGLKYFQGPAARELASQELVALDMDGDTLWQSHLSENLHVLVGEEGQGVPTNFSGQRISIPMENEVESLNAGVAASLILGEWKRQQQ